MREDSIAAPRRARRRAARLPLRRPAGRCNRRAARPYDAHLCRVGLDGAGFEQLTEAPGRHEVSLSPSHRFFLDTHTNVDPLPTTELRRTDGELLATLAAADSRPLEALGWSPPEEFRVTAADGETELWGILHKPYGFDPDERYPVIDLMSGRPDIAVNEMQRTHSQDAEAWASTLPTPGWPTASRACFRSSWTSVIVIDRCPIGCA